MKRNVLVTGGAGFIGSHLVERLVSQGDNVTVVDNLATGYYSNLNSVWADAPFWLGSLLDRMEKIDFGYFDIVFHLAGNAHVSTSVDKPEMDMRANFLTTFYLLNSLRQCSKPPKLINISSAAVYGNPTKLPISEEDPTVPISPYGASKLAAENYVSIFCKLYGLPGASARLFSVYGPRQRKQVVYDFFRMLHKRPETFLIWGNGTQARDFVYVTDVIDALIYIANRAPARGEVYNVASGYSTTVDQLAEACKLAAGSKANVVYEGVTRPGDVDRWEADIRRIKNIGYRSKVHLKDGLKATWGWYNTLNK